MAALRLRGIHLALALVLACSVQAVLGGAAWKRRPTDCAFPFGNDAPGTAVLPFPLHWYSLAAALSQGAYCSQPYIAHGARVGDATVLGRIGNGQTSPHTVVYHSETLGVVLAYQGTNQSSIPSLLYDVDFLWREPASELHLPWDAFVDGGFQDAWQSNWEETKGVLAVARETYPNSNLTITGHSLGAAAAIFAALALGPNEVDTIITFGQPRMGTKAFADTVDSRFGPSRLNFVVNGDDLVPHLIPRIVGPPRPQHFSGSIWISPGNATLETHGPSAYTFYPGQENCNGFDHVLPPKWTTHDHEGWYMGTRLAGRGHTNCPVKISNT